MTNSHERRNESVDLDRRPPDISLPEIQPLRHSNSPRILALSSICRFSLTFLLPSFSLFLPSTFFSFSLSTVGYFIIRKSIRVTSELSSSGSISLLETLTSRCSRNLEVVRFSLMFGDSANYLSKWASTGDGRKTTSDSKKTSIPAFPIFPRAMQRTYRVYNEDCENKRYITIHC